MLWTYLTTALAEPVMLALLLTAFIGGMLFMYVVLQVFGTILLAGNSKSTASAARILKSIDQSVICTDLQGNIMYWNDFAETLFGWRKEEVLGKSIIDVLSPTTSLEQANEIMKALQAGQSWCGCFDAHRKDKSILTLFVNDSALMDENGNMVGIVGVSCDFTKRQNVISVLRKQQREAEEQLRLVNRIINITNTACIVTDKNQLTTFVNDAFTKVTGWEPEDIVGKRPSQVLQGPKTNPATVKKMRECLSEGRDCHVNITNYKKDGSEIEVSLQINPVKDKKTGEIISFVAIQQDVTESFSMRKELEQAKRIVLANQLKAEFVTTVSHELRTPLNGIIGTTTTLLDIFENGTVESKEESIEKLTIILSSSQLLLALVNNIIEVRKIEEGMLTARKDVVSVDKLAMDTFLVCSPIAIPKNITLKRSLVGPLRILGDKTKLKQILINLISNSIKFSPCGEEITLDLRHFTKGSNKCKFKQVKKILEHNDCLLCSVKDNGPGIPISKSKILFQKWASPIFNEGGAGLGLNICHNFVKLMGGSIWLDTSITRGATFYFAIVANKHQSKGSRNSSPLTRKFGTRSRSLSTGNSDLYDGLHILVAEDNLVNRKVMAMILRRLRHRCTFAENGQEVLDILGNALLAIIQKKSKWLTFFFL
mmetsp:Transcript_434/g.514  ORF Transcript_434/g.514 Transcript_434/m.514 type:complete len:654 (-) Transcript_434:335-2296(-)